MTPPGRPPNLAPLSITLYGEPVAQGRPRGVRLGGHRILFYDPPAARHWKKEAALLLRSERHRQWGAWRPPADSLWSLEANFYLRRPRAHYRANGALKPHAQHFCARRPDLDNLAKTLLDALVQAGIFEDDSRVVELIARKYWAQDRGRDRGPRVELLLTVTPPPESAAAAIQSNGS